MQSDIRKYTRYIKYINLDGEEKSLFLYEIVGKGSYGDVFKGSLDGYGEVAVKILKEIDKDKLYDEIHLPNKHLKYSAFMKKFLTYRDNFEEKKINSGECIPLDLIGIIISDNGQFHKKKSEYFQIYDLIDGVTLAQNTEFHKNFGIEFEPEILHNYIRDMLLGMKELIDNKIVHRDIKPDNIMIHRGTIKYIDFGFACQHDDCPRNVLLGTYAYMSPNALFHIFDFHKDDIFALGITIFFLIKHYILYDCFLEKKVYNRLLNGEKIDYKAQVIKFLRQSYTHKVWSDLVESALESSPNYKYAKLIIGMTLYHPSQRYDIDTAIRVFNEIKV